VNCAFLLGICMEILLSIIDRLLDFFSRDSAPAVEPHGYLILYVGASGLLLNLFGLVVFGGHHHHHHHHHDHGHDHHGHEHGHGHDDEKRPAGREKSAGWCRWWVRSRVRPHDGEHVSLDLDDDEVRDEAT
jgi:ABC-type nickel/cobalt efflux system permease component RcnA